MKALLRRVFVAATLASLLLAAGCAGPRLWVNAPLDARSEAPMAVAAHRAPAGERVGAYGVLALSGGGARAAAFAYGVMEELKATPLTWQGRETTVLDEVDVVHAVSGGSILAAYWAAFGDATFPGFEHEFLRESFQRSLVTHALRPDNLVRMASPHFGRSHVLAERLDRLFRGRTYADVAARPGAPQLVLSATDLTLGTSFEFSPEQFAMICSDLDSVPLSFATAASSAVPLLLSPLTLRNHADDCPWPLPEPQAIAGEHGHQAALLQMQVRSYLDGARRPWIHLVDGGLADNLGVRRTLDTVIAHGGLQQTTGPESARGTVRRLFIIAVNAERDPGYRIDLSDRTPTTMQVLDSLMFGSGSQASRETLALLQHSVQQWQRELRTNPPSPGSAFAADIALHVVTVNLRDVADPGLRDLLLRIPTAFSLADEDVTRLIAAGRDALRASPEFAALLASLREEPVDGLRAAAPAAEAAPTR